MSKSIHSPINSPPTERQIAILAFIFVNYLERGWAPTLREIGAKFGIKSTNGVNDHLRALERRGFLRRQRHLARAMAVTMEAQDILDERGLLP